MKLAPGTRITAPIKAVTDAEYDAEYGPAVLNGVPLRTSVSALQTLDPNTYGGCHRAWWFDKIGGKRAPETKAHTIGKRELHEPIEAYYKTGVEHFSPLVLQGRHLLYPYGEEVLIEREIARPLDAPEDTPIDLSKAPLRVDGIPLVGRIDLVHALGYYIDSNGARIIEPPNTAEVRDWKSTGKREYAKTGPQLMSQTIQMPGYGKWLTLQEPNLERVRLTHSYFCKDPKDHTAWNATILVTREQIDRRWEYVDGLGRVMRDVARETNVEKVDGNRKSCDAYGRKGCPHKPSNGGTCSLGEFNSLSRIFGDKGAGRILDDQPTAPLSDDEGILPVMGLLKNIKPATATNPPNTPANVQAVNTAQHVGVEISLPPPAAAVDMLAALAEEQAKTTTAAPVVLAPEVIAAFDVIEQAALGCPDLGGAAADARREYIALKITGQRTTYTPGSPVEGNGRLKGLAAHTTIEQLLALAENLRAVIAKQKAAAEAAANATPAPAATSAPAIVSPETPASNPALASVPVEGHGTPAATVTTTATPKTIVIENTTKGEVLEVAATTAPAESKPEPEAPKATTRRGRKPGSTNKPKSESDDGDPFELYIDCVPSQPYELADQYVSLLNVKLCELLKVTEIPDIRSVGKNGPDALSYTSWIGTYEALAREAAADGHIPRARYVVFTDGNQLAQLFANALIAARHKSESGSYDGALVLDNYTRGVK